MVFEADLVFEADVVSETDLVFEAVLVSGVVGSAVIVAQPTFDHRRNEAASCSHTPGNASEWLRIRGRG
jgi:hypothetical protein